MDPSGEVARRDAANRRPPLPSSPALAVIVGRMGPYHAARLAAASLSLGRIECVCIEVAAQTREYAWDAVTSSDAFRRRTLIQDVDYEVASSRRRSAEVVKALTQENPRAVAINGWAEPEARAALRWCCKWDRIAILMSETQKKDRPRYRATEFVKGWLVRQFDAALVGGRSHADYLVSLGMPPEAISLGYDVVDNEHFMTGADRARKDESRLRNTMDLPPRYFLASARFVAKKNLEFLLNAYAEYRRSAPTPWDLVLLGDGPLRQVLEAKIGQLGIGSCVRLPGFKQYSELPAYYGLASAFVLASKTEQWGLVVNEAMAAGLPVLVSRTAGSVEMVVEGETGFSFDPVNIREIAAVMLRISREDLRIGVMGKNAQNAIASMGPRRFAQGLEAALQVGARRQRRAGLLLGSWRRS
jgi:1,2-diacylglycerol 3-alpha-glucosyltransferase